MTDRRSTRERCSTLPDTIPIEDTIGHQPNPAGNVSKNLSCIQTFELKPILRSMARVLNFITE